MAPISGGAAPEEGQLAGKKVSDIDTGHDT